MALPPDLQAALDSYTPIDDEEGALCAEEILAGKRDVSNLGSCFIWADTPQTHDYWQAICIGERSLDGIAKDILQKFVDAYRQKQKPEQKPERKPAGDFRLEPHGAEGVRRLLDGTEGAEVLWRSFVWDRTPQGRDYWRPIANGLRPLDDEAKGILRQWLEASKPQQEPEQAQEQPVQKQAAFPSFEEVSKEFDAWWATHEVTGPVPLPGHAAYYAHRFSQAAWHAAFAKGAGQ
jgi:hypothetical protein